MLDTKNAAQASTAPLPAKFRPSKSVLSHVFGPGALDQLGDLIEPRREDRGPAVFCVDSWFRGRALEKRLPLRSGDRLLWVDSSVEPTTTAVNAFYDQLKAGAAPCVVVGVGGGASLDTAKALSNLLGNGGRAEDYQGWDLLPRPGVHKIGVPTISGTGAETSRTCVMINPANGLKLGMNSDHSIYDQLVLDPELSRTVPHDQYFFTGMDSYVHCLESLRGRHRHAIGDAYSHQSIALCREVFLSQDMMSDRGRESMMVASYLGGCAIANSYVGVVHPFSAGLSVVLGLHHGLANCVVMGAMDEYYPEESREFREMAKRQGVTVPSGVARGLDDAAHERLYRATIIHEKPLANALGPDFKSILTPAKVREIFLRM